MERCPICSNWETRCEIETVCPICGAPGVRAELDAIARQWIEWYFDRYEDLRVFGTPLPKETIQ